MQSLKPKVTREDGEGDDKSDRPSKRMKLITEQEEVSSRDTIDSYLVGQAGERASTDDTDDDADEQVHESEGQLGASDLYLDTVRVLSLTL